MSRYTRCPTPSRKASAYLGEPELGFAAAMVGDRGRCALPGRALPVMCAAVATVRERCDEGQALAGRTAQVARVAVHGPSGARGGAGRRTAYWLAEALAGRTCGPAIVRRSGWNISTKRYTIALPCLCYHGSCYSSHARTPTPPLGGDRLLNGSRCRKWCIWDSFPLSRRGGGRARAVHHASS